MNILGLTGSIGMGKSAAALMLRRLGVPVHDADKVVHNLMSSCGKLIYCIEKMFPGVAYAGAVDRRLLGQIAFSNPADLKRLEEVVHPFVEHEERLFLAAHRRARTALVVLDIPLLYETGAEQRCDSVAVVSAPYRVQRSRVMTRPGMTQDKFQSICARQLSDCEKRRRADWVIPTGLGKRVTFAYLKATVVHLRSQ